MLSLIEASSLPLLYKLSVALPAGNKTRDQTHPKKDKTNLRIDCGFLLVVISNEVLIVGIADSMCSSSDVSSRELIVSRARRFVWGRQINRLVTVAHFP